VNLDDATSGKRMWSQEFSGVTKDLLTIEDQISAQLVTALAVKPTNEEAARAAAHPTENIEAYDLYLKGRDAIHTQQDVKNAKTAMGYYEDALKKDPRFALAYAGLAEASLVMYGENKDAFWSQKALAAAQQAGSLNDNLPEVHFSLGNVYRHTGRTAEAVTELKRALELAPNSDDGYRSLGEAYLALGEKDQGLQALQKAIQINPYYWQNYNALGMAYSGLGEYDKALTAFQRVMALEPDNYFGYLNVGAIYFQEGQYEESITYFQKSLQLQPYYLTYSNLGTALFFLKRYSESVPMFEKAVEMNPNEQLAVGNLADAYRWSGQRDKANATYDKAIALAFKELQVNPRNSDSMGSLAVYYAKKGDTAQALDNIRRARTINPTDLNLIYMEAQVYALANRPDEALKSLRQALQRGYSAKEASNDPELSTLQGRPEFVRLMKEFGKPN
jgi:eukaryotic-like serine/threonine-protein kinase